MSQQPKLQTVVLESSSIGLDWGGDVPISYQVYGQPLHTAPVVLVVHALTGNSELTGPRGWWNEQVGDGKAIDISRFTVLSLNIPGNGHDGFHVQDHADWNAQIVTRAFESLLNVLEVTEIDYAIGGSLGGGLLWHLAVARPRLIKHLIAVATHHTSSAWIIAHNTIQEQLLGYQENGMDLARQVATLFYRTPQSFNDRFHRDADNEGNYQAANYIKYQGKKLRSRYHHRSYRLMNHLFTSIDAFKDAELLDGYRNLQTTITQITIDSDLLFSPRDNEVTHQQLLALGKESYLYSIRSSHGHDAFLIEHAQLDKLLRNTFKTTPCHAL